MKKEFTIDYKKRTISIDAIRKIISIDKRIVTLINMIKILGSDGIYYAELQYVFPYRAYVVYQ